MIKNTSKAKNIYCDENEGIGFKNSGGILRRNDKNFTKIDYHIYVNL